MKERQMNSFDAAVLRQIGHIRAIGRRLLRDRSELDDFVQETVLRVYSNRAQLRDPAKLKQWIAGVARNTALEWNRQKRELPIADVDAIPADERSPHDDLERTERNERVHQALGMLKPVDRELLLARYMEEATYEELQKRHGLSYSAVGFRLFKARQRLKKLLTAMKIALAWTLSSMKQNAHGGVLIMTKSTKVALVAAAAALIALVSGVWTAKQIQSGANESIDGSTAERAGDGGGMSIPLDETGQSPRLRQTEASDAPKKQKTQTQATAADRHDTQAAAANRLDTQAAAADQLDAQEREGANIRNGEEEQMTKTDYSFWDSTTDVERVGVYVYNEHQRVEYRSEEDRKRRETIQNDLLGMETRGIVSLTPKDGFEQWTSEDGKETRYVAQEELPAFAALKKEDRAIESRSTTTIARDGSGRISSMIGTTLEDGTRLEYYRRRSDGSLMRQAKLANGRVKRWVAGPPPDLSDFSAGIVNIMRGSWRPE